MTTETEATPTPEALLSQAQDGARAAIAECERRITAAHDGIQAALSQSRGEIDASKRLRVEKVTAYHQTIRDKRTAIAAYRKVLPKDERLARKASK